MIMETLYLDLRAPLAYAKAPGLTFSNCVFPENDDSPELLFCFELDKEQAQRIDPQADLLLGDLVFAGRGADRQGKIVLPAGSYVFSQQRRSLSIEECIDCAVEQQKDGMWERYKLDNILYIRFLFEDHCTVTQLFRACV